MRTVIKKNVILLFCIAAILGCDKLPSKYNTSKSDLVGVWSITDSSLEKLVEEGYSKYSKKSDHRIEFLNDGSCIISTYMYTFLHPSLQEQEEMYLNAEARTWKITKKKGFTKGLTQQIHSIPAIEMKYQSIKKEGNHTHTDTKVSHLYISTVNDSTVLWNYIGDPDSKRYIEFKKN
jgi:hypothetical protein